MVNVIGQIQRPPRRSAVKSCKLAGQPRRDSPRSLARWIAVFTLTGLTGLSACATPGPSNLTQARHNCMLPGQVTRIGGQAFLTARRAVTTDRANCEAQGGEPVIMSDPQVSVDSQ